MTFAQIAFTLVSLCSIGTIVLLGVLVWRITGRIQRDLTAGKEGE